MKLKKPPFKYIFLFLDLVILTAAYVYAVACIDVIQIDISLKSAYNVFSHLSLYAIFIAIFIFAFRYNNLYKRNVVITHRKQLAKLLNALIGGVIAVMVFMALSNVYYLVENGRELLIDFFIVALPAFILYRPVLGKSLYRFLTQKNIQRRNVLIVGGDEAAIYAAKTLMADEFSDFIVVGFLDDYKAKGVDIFDGYENLGHLNEIGDTIRDLGADEILIAIDHAPYNRLIHIVECCLATGVDVRIYSDFLAVIADKMDVEFYASIPVIDLPQKPLDGNDWKDKRTFDILLSALAMVLLAPLFLFIAAGIKLSSKGPVIFKQTRIGKNGSPFDFYKFRSMHVGNSSNIHKDYVTNFIKGNAECAGDQEINVFKITDDPRIFKFGKFIRKTSLDEFPQFYNVLVGDMGLVGPRPCLPYEWDCYEDWHKKRLNVLPGCTGLWQALGRSAVSFEEMVILDLYYISNASLWLDFKIVLKTFPVIFFGKGGH
jgi:undecaprenyl-phosphate galactose phosphotransferase